MGKTLIINAGSASKKYAVFADGLLMEKFYESPKANLRTFFDENPQQDINTIAFRVVAPGEYFQAHKEVDDEYIKTLEKNISKAPLHINPVLSEIKLAKEVFSNIKLVAISDSEFHKTIPDFNFTYPLQGVRKYGYHGISNSSVVRQINHMTSDFPKKLITCHLGSGVSITAIKAGHSFDTSMGFTPLGGVVMNTRPGDMDPGAIIYYQLKSNLSPEELEKELNNNSGIKNISELDGGVKALLESDSEKAKLALKIFANQVTKFIGGYAAEMGGVDWIVFTATISERAPKIRKMILENLEFLNVKLDENLNEEKKEKIGFINTDDSKIKIAVIPTQETQEMWEISKSI